MTSIALELHYRENIHFKQFHSSANGPRVVNTECMGVSRCSLTQCDINVG